MNKTTKITGNTYSAREWLKKCGFEWDKDSKCWTGDDAAREELKRTSTATYSRANLEMLASLKVETI